ncbi:UNVERIFIED_CONTAM: hypothetical protein K2H54_053695, partial [Gekko kuhli]
PLFLIHVINSAGKALIADCAQEGKLVKKKKKPTPDAVEIKRPLMTSFMASQSMIGETSPLLFSLK